MKLAELLQDDGQPAAGDPGQCFALRTLLIHHYRKLLLKDPDLPAALLPAQWAGHRAWQLCGTIYRAVRNASESYLVSLGENRNGSFRRTSEEYRARFGA